MRWVGTPSGRTALAAALGIAVVIVPGRRKKQAATDRTTGPHDTAISILLLVSAGGLVVLPKTTSV
jgi:hypothetical protein